MDGVGGWYGGYSYSRITRRTRGNSGGDDDKRIDGSTTATMKIDKVKDYYEKNYGSGKDNSTKTANSKNQTKVVKNRMSGATVDRI